MLNQLYVHIGTNSEGLLEIRTLVWKITEGKKRKESSESVQLSIIITIIEDKAIVAILFLREHLASNLTEHCYYADHAVTKCYIHAHGATSIYLSYINVTLFIYIHS